MYNLAISIGVALLAFLGGYALAGWLAGILPALLAGGVAYFLLARRTGRQLEALMQRAADAIQKGRIDKGRKLMEQGFGLAKWQFLIAEQIHGQLGALDYLQRRYPSARDHLAKAWSRNWMSKAMLACIEHREGKHDAALAQMEEVSGPGGKDPVYWALYAWLAIDARDPDKALAVLVRGIEKNPDSTALKELADMVRNKKRIKPQKAFSAFAPAWYQFFPEHMSRSQMMQMQGQRPGGYSYPQPKGFRR
ncbi:MAG: hypothetical protein D6798_00480 [Deltaproteobacteria bacterium]|nr:MAG: hypothetical protein D6798_00480 [Deltaproteobacteria bacterium]